MARTSEGDGGTNQFNEYLITNNSGTYLSENQNSGFQTSSSSLDTVWAATISNIGSSKAVINFGAGTFTTTAGLTLANSNINLISKEKLIGKKIRITSYTEIIG